MRNACPSCQTVYAVTPNDVGRRIVCKRCNAALVIDDEGFRLESPPTEAPMPSEVKSKRRNDEPPKEKIDYLAWAKKHLDPSTVVFGFGVVVVLWYLFMPILGNASESWYRGRITSEQLNHDAELKRLRDTGKKEAETKLEEEWQKRKEKLERDVKLVGASNQQSVYWDRWGILFGFMVTALGSIGLLASPQPTVKKIVGAIVVCAMMLLVFITFLTRG